MKRENMSCQRAVAALLAASVLGAAAGGCHTAPPASETAAHPSRHAAAKLEQNARLRTKPDERSEKLLDAAEQYIALRLFEDALRCLNDVRRANYTGALAGRCHRLLGEVYLARGESVIAERYLLKGLSEARGDERELTVARLVVAARARGDAAAAARYEKRLSRPRSPEVERVLAQRVRDDFHRMPDSASDEPIAAARPRPEVRRSPAPAPRSPVRIIPRWKWHPQPVRGDTNPMTRIEKITIHHTGDRQAFWGRTLHSAAHEIQKIQRYHQDTNHWADIGYHFIVDRSGNIWQGRPLRYQGAHARHENPGNIGIALLGNYTRQRLTPEQRASLERFLRLLVRHYDLPPGRIYTHREILDGRTACPGREISNYVASLRREIGTTAVAYGK